MVTVPEDVYPVLVELAGNMDTGAASVIRMLLQESLPQLTAINDGLRLLKQGNQNQALLGMTAHLLKAQAELSNAAAASIREAEELTASKPQVEAPKPKPAPRKKAPPKK